MKYPLENPPLQSGYNFYYVENARAIKAAAGTSILMGFSRNRTAVFSVAWQLQEAEARTLLDWYEKDLRFGELPFTMSLLIEAGMIEQQCYFVEDSFKAFTNGDGQSFRISAKILVPEVSNPDNGDYAVLLDQYRQNGNLS